MLNLTTTGSPSFRSTWRLLRATLRDWWVLWREFRWPLVLFLLLNGGVAMLFYTYYTHPDYPGGLDFDEALFAVLSLNIVQPVLPMPAGPGHWLTVFYFLMPVVGIVLAGQGLANFLSLLFNRRARGAAWHEAVASTYRNHVVVCGLGHVGSRVVESLLNAGSEVVGIEQEPHSSLAERVRGWGVPIIEGDIRQREVLRRAGVPRARAVVICTNNDLANLDAALHCRELNPGVRLVLRLFDPELAHRVKDVFAIDEAFSASALAAPIFAGAALEVEIDRTFSIDEDVLSVGRLTVHAGSRLHGRTVGYIEDNFDCSIISHERDGQRDMHPRDTIELLPGDRIIVLADLPTLNRLAGQNRE
jgi:Trk K+ transport system NAD-binding subunit